MVTLNWSGYKKLTVENIGELPTFAGVYKFALYNTQTEKYKPFYIGQADDIKVRTQQHTSSNETNTCIKAKFNSDSVYINYAAVSRQDDRDAVEVALFNYYVPECNDPKALPDVEPADVSSFN